MPRIVDNIIALLKTRPVGHLPNETGWSDVINVTLTLEERDIILHWAQEAKLPTMAAALGNLKNTNV